MAWELYHQVAGLAAGRRPLPQPDHGGSPWGEDSWDGLWAPLAASAQVATGKADTAALLVDLRALALKVLSRLARVKAHAAALAASLDAPLFADLCGALGKHQSGAEPLKPAKAAKAAAKRLAKHCASAGHEL